MSGNSGQPAGQASNGIGFAGALFLVFLVLKLTHVIDWSWWWITAPLWAGTALVLAVALLAGLVLLTLRTINALRRRLE